MPTRPLRRSALVLGLSALAIVPSAALHAQGAIAVQGFGYPTGQLSPAALGTGGATAELDATSPLNPAALGVQGRYSTFVHFEPEFRRTVAGGNVAEASVMRFPTLMVSGRYRRFAVAGSYAMFLDRTWANTYRDSVMIEGQPVASTIVTASDGAIGDARLAASYSVTPWLIVGAGLHAYSGQNRLNFDRVFDEDSAYAPLSQTTSMSYAGSAVSVGALVTLPGRVVVGASLRQGGSMDAEQNAEIVGDAKVPARYGVSVSWAGVPGASLSARLEKTAWTDMGTLGTSSLSVFDATDFGIGTEILGPRIRQAPSIIRLGLRDRTLPFGTNGEQVSERGFSGGVGIPVARGRAQLDLTLQRASREAGSLREKAWFVSVGVGIR